MKKLLLSAAFAITGMVSAFASGHTVTVTSTPASCYGMCDGSATATVTGGVGPFTYVWSPGSTTAPTESGLCAGNYTVTVTDGNDMSTATATVTVTEPAAITLTAGSSSPVCAHGTLVLNASAVSGGTYSWVGPAGFTSSNQNPTIVSYPLTGTATFTVTVSVGMCTAVATTTVYTDNLSGTITSTNASGCGACDGTASIMPVGGTAPYAYSWSNGITTQTSHGLCPGWYSIVTTDPIGCTATDSVLITAPPAYADFSVIPDSANGYNIYTFNTTSGSGLNYSWDFGDGTTSASFNPSHTYAAPGTYSVCLQIASFLGGCYDTVCKSVVITGTPDACLALFNIGDDTTNTDPNAFTVYNLSYGATLSYSWDFGDGNTSTLRNPTHVYAGMGAYQICLTVDNGSGCTHTYCDSIMSVDSLGRSNSLSFTTVSVPYPGVVTVTGISEQSVKASVDVYPNPFTDNATFVISDKANGVYSFELTDVLGKKVKSISGISQKQFTISRDALQSGMYFYKIYSANKVIGIGKLTVK